MYRSLVHGQQRCFDHEKYGELFVLLRKHLELCANLLKLKQFPLKSLIIFITIHRYTHSIYTRFCCCRRFFRCFYEASKIWHFTWVYMQWFSLISWVSFSNTESERYRKRKGGWRKTERQRQRRANIRLMVLSITITYSILQYILHIWHIGWYIINIMSMCTLCVCVCVCARIWWRNNECASICNNNLALLWANCVAR